MEYFNPNLANFELHWQSCAKYQRSFHSISTGSKSLFFVYLLKYGATSADKKFKERCIETSMNSIKFEGTVRRVRTSMDGCKCYGVPKKIGKETK